MRFLISSWNTFLKMDLKCNPSQNNFLSAPLLFINTHVRPSIDCLSRLSIDYSWFVVSNWKTDFYCDWTMQQRWTRRGHKMCVEVGIYCLLHKIFSWQTDIAVQGQSSCSTRCPWKDVGGGLASNIDYFLFLIDTTYSVLEKGLFRNTIGIAQQWMKKEKEQKTVNISRWTSLSDHGEIFTLLLNLQRILLNKKDSKSGAWVSKDRRKIQIPCQQFSLSQSRNPLNVIPTIASIEDYAIHSRHPSSTLLVSVLIGLFLSGSHHILILDVSIDWPIFCSFTNYHDFFE